MARRWPWLCKPWEEEHVSPTQHHHSITSTHAQQLTPLPVITTTLIALISNARKEDMAPVIACSYLFRSLGSSLGISVGAAILQVVLRSQLAAGLGSGDAAWEIEQRVRESLDYIKQLDPATANIVRHAYQVAVIHVFAFQAVPLGLAVVCALFIREKSLGK